LLHQRLEITLALAGCRTGGIATSESQRFNLEVICIPDVCEASHYVQAISTR
jgi:hypothetical protein